MVSFNEDLKRWMKDPKFKKKYKKARVGIDKFDKKINALAKKYKKRERKDAG